MSKNLIEMLVKVNHILANEGVVDAFGHISHRHPDNPDRYLLSCSRSPELVQEEDIMEFQLDGTPVDARGRKPYLERYIHGAVYARRPDIQSVVHNHAYEVLPYSVTGTPLKPILHTAGRIGENIPVWDIHEHFGDTNLLVTNNEQGNSLADALGDSYVALMRGHGCVVAGINLQEAVLTAVYLVVNARIQQQAMQLGDVTYLTSGEADLNSQLNQPPVATERAWEYLLKRVQD
ncbi:MAG: class II aldolase/adducin family protein [Desulfobulbia bacterium]